MLIKHLSDYYPLHEMVFVRSVIGIVFSLILVQLEGGWRILKTSRPGLHFLRALMLVMANMLFFTSITVLPLADASAIFFISPVLITLLSVPLLGEAIDRNRIAGVLLGFIGVVIIMQPGKLIDGHPDFAMYCLPLLAALAYAVMQVLTRKLGVASKASAIAVYLQLTFMSVAAIFWVIAGDGRYVDQFQDPGMVFLLRAWEWPASDHLIFLGFLGILQGIIAYCGAQAYRLAQVTDVAPFEYAALPLAIFWGWAVFGDLPDQWAMIGMCLIAGAGLSVYVRKKQIAPRSAP
jgi:S-adenosylmethionine uptake transporter